MAEKGRNRTPAELERDRRNIGRLYLQGRLQAEIGDELGIDQSTVSRDLKALQDEWRRERVMDINEAKQKELAKIDVLELTYWEAWERSKENAETETTKMQGAAVAGAQPTHVEKQKRVEGQVGDPRFLQGVERCIERRCKILGIDAPQALTVGNPDGSNITQPLDAETVAMKVASLMELARQRKENGG